MFNRKDCSDRNHDFKARYDSIPVTSIDMGVLAAIRRIDQYENPSIIMSLTHTSKYIHDICIRCGKIVKRTSGE